MRKMLNMLTALLIAAASISLCACGSDNDDEPKGENALHSICWSISGGISGDANEIFEYTASILLPNGNKYSLTDITLSNPSKLTGILTASEVEMPAEFTMCVERKVKDGYIASEGTTATWSESFALNVALLDDANYCINEKQAGYNDEKLGVKLAEWLPEFGDYTQSVTITLRKSGDSYMLE